MGLHSSSLLQRLALSVGSGSLDELLGAPRSSDVVIKTNDSTTEITILSWVWAQGGWQAQEATKDLLIRGSDIRAQEYIPEILIDRDVNHDDVYLFHAAIGYERSVDDNHFKAICPEGGERHKNCAIPSIIRTENE